MVDNINGINSAGGAGHAKRLRKTYQQPEKAAAGADSVQMSSEVKNLQELSGVDGIRLDKVMAVKKALADGSYITFEKLDKALDGAIDDAYGIKKENSQE